MKKFRFNKATEIGLLFIVLGSCIKFANHLYAVLVSIGFTEGVITNVEFNIYRFKIFTTIEQYEVHISPTYSISVLLIIYLTKLVIDYLKHRKQENRFYGDEEREGS
ncbi:hypothetical protein [Paenibacillus fonticola]|uniref:hypothetical protein n=1 Tax=Paenibacillus fonticola TaxID=379896 RepID=UPI000371B624|nr:hypothetical protein [Paenibacillus fonticola]